MSAARTLRAKPADPAALLVVAVAAGPHGMFAIANATTVEIVSATGAHIAIADRPSGARTPRHVVARRRDRRYSNHLAELLLYRLRPYRAMDATDQRDHIESWRIAGSTVAHAGTLAGALDALDISVDGTHVAVHTHAMGGPPID